MTDRLDRRTLLARGGATIGVAAAGVLAGCSQSGPDGGDEGLRDPLSTVPEGVDRVAVADVEALLADEATESVADAYLGGRAERPGYDGPTTFEEQLAAYEERSGLDSAAVGVATQFGTRPPEPSSVSPADRLSGTVVGGSLTVGDVVDGLSENRAYEEREHRGRSLRAPATGDGLWVADLDGPVVVGTETGVRAAVDVRAGERSAVSGPLRTAVEETDEGLARGASVVRPSDLRTALGDLDRNLSGVLDVERARGTLTADGDRRSLRVVLTASDRGTAADLTDVLTAYLIVERLRAGDGPRGELYASIDVARDGREVRLTYRDAVTDIEGIAADIGRDGGLGALAGLAGPTPARPAGSPTG
jgi:hypothetical protein